MVEILVADDHPLFQYAITDFVERNIPDTKTISCIDLEEALNTAEENPDIDLVLLDLNMPGMDGLALLRRICMSPRMRHIPVVMISARSELDGISKALAIGARDYLIKPVRKNMV